MGAVSKPYPWALVLINDKKLKKLKSRVFSDNHEALPGLVVRITDAGVMVSCGDEGVVLLDFLEFADTEIRARRVSQYI